MHALSELANRYIETIPDDNFAQSAVRGFTNIVNEHGLNFMALDRDGWTEVFSSYKVSLIILKRYQRKLKLFYAWLAEEQGKPSLSQETLKNFKIAFGDTVEFDKDKYFSSLDDLLNTLDKAVEPHDGDYGTYAPSVCLLLLSWYSIHVREALELQKSDLVFTAEECRVANKLTIREPRVVKALRRYANATTLKVADGKVYNYYASPFLFRTYDTNKITFDATRRHIAQLNRRVKESGLTKSVSFYGVTRSAVFSRTFDAMYARRMFIYPKASVDDIPMFEPLFETTFFKDRATNFHLMYHEFYSWCRAFRGNYPRLKMEKLE